METKYYLMKFRLWLGMAAWLSVLLFSCRDEIDFDSPSGSLSFSSDTVFLDTVYNQVRSETYAVKVYNRLNKNVRIPHLYLEGGAASPYRINVDGKPGTDFRDVPLRANDSLYIFVEIAPTANAIEAIAEDRIKFEGGSRNQHITLFSVVQDAEFFISTGDSPKFITENTVWKNDKAKIVFGKLVLQQGKTLTVNKGTKIYFHKNSSLILEKESELVANGDYKEEVIFRGDRNDPRYDTLPANWNGIEAVDGARIKLNFAKLQGGNTALKLKNAKAELRNTIIHSFQDFGIDAENSTVEAHNLVMNSFGAGAARLAGGGDYDFIHSTIANYWTANTTGDAGGILIDKGENAPFSLKLQNSILYGSNANMLTILPSAANVFTYLIQNSLVKYDRRSAGFNWEGNPMVIASKANESPKFLQTGIAKMNLRVAEDSPARNLGNATIAQIVPYDIVKMSRLASPTAGAYQ